MWRGKTQSLQSIDLVHGFEQLHKWTFIIDPRRFVAAVQVHDLPEQRNFLHSTRDQVAHFAHDLINRTAALRATRLRDDAKRAVHVASLHDRDKGGRLPRRELLLANCFLRARLFGDVDDRETWIVHSAVAGVGDSGYNFHTVLLGDEFVHIVGDAMEFLRPDHKIDMWQILEQQGTARLRHAAKETEH